MITLQLTPFAKARVWFHSATPGFAPSGVSSASAVCDPAIVVATEHVTIEAYVPRGAYVEYGLLGLRLERDSANSLRIDVPYTTTVGTAWPDSLGAFVDDVRLGLPEEYAIPIRDTVVGFGTSHFPPGTIRVIEAAHGLVGSSADVFRRLATAALSLMLNDRKRDKDDTNELLRALLVERRSMPPGALHR